ncbi:hypothetical protein [Paraflavitalea speifideaquila]|uniref:hypothetical protein n=1 Tax=Paraflavitalea speifideaquila TaxID=3076558 RepID=UPI0028E45CCF|nr:hypothetical protein [Paraflavitalea speifideiaquila]
MKHSKVFFIVLIALTSITACKKGDTGDTGPAGPTGNADVTVYNFGQTTFTSATNLLLNNISQGRMDSSLVLAYYNPVPEALTSWYPIPGSGSGGLYEMRYFVYQSATSPNSVYTFGLRAIKPDGTPYATALIFRKIKIIIAPAGVVIAGGRQMAGVNTLPVDINDYHAVCRYYGISE